MADVLHVRGRILLDVTGGTGALDLTGARGPDQLEVRDELWVLDGRVTWTPPGPGHDVTTLTGWVLPGLVDAHCHVGLGPDGPVAPEVARRQAATDAVAGALLLRDAGSPADTRWLDGEPGVPRILRAGRHLARTRRYLRGVAHELEPEDLPAAAAEQARRGDGWVKIVVDWVDREAGDLAPCWPRSALAAAVSAAHAQGARVAVHTFSAAGVADALAAGVDCVEHGTGLDDEGLAAAARAGTALTPTLVNTANFPEIAARGEAKFPRYAATMRALHGRREQVLRDAHEAGVRLLAGTDAGTVMPHGLIAAEVAALAAAGLPPVAALDAACWGARRYLGAPGLDEGAPADLVVLADDPLADVRALSGPRTVVVRGRRLPSASCEPTPPYAAGAPSA